MNEGFFGGHLFCSESEHKSHRKRKTFQNSDNNQCYRNYQNPCEGDALLTSCTMKTGQGKTRGGERKNTYRTGSPVPDWTKKRIIREMNRIKPAAPSIFAMSPTYYFSVRTWLITFPPLAHHLFGHLFLLYFFNLFCYLFRDLFYVK